MKLGSITVPIVLLAFHVTAQAPLPTAPAGVLIDEPYGDGEFWARGDGYKARFAADGVTFYPLVDGATAPAPATLRHDDDVVAPRRDGNDLVYRHASGIEERWSVRRDGLEQSFVVRERPASGVLTLRVTVAGALQYRGRDGGLTFAAAAVGMRYGDGTVVDADGRRAAVPAVYRDGGIELSVSEAFLRDARLPVTVDPLLSNLTVAAQSISEFSPDVCYDPITGHIVVVFEEIVGSGDHDVVGVEYDESGNVLRTIPFDITAEPCSAPKVCAMQQAGLVAAVWDNDGSSHQGIQARVHRLPQQQTLSVAQMTSDGFGQDSMTPDIGGTSATSPPQAAQAMVVFARKGLLGKVSLNGALLDGFGQPASAGEFEIEDDEGCDPRPSISPNAGSPTHWVVAWQRRDSQCANGDVFAAAVDLGGLLAGTMLVNAGAQPDVLPTVVTSGSDTQILWQLTTVQNANDIAARHLVRGVGSSFSFVGVNQVLSVVEPGVNRANSQFSPAVAFDGCRYAYAYMEDALPKAACFTFDGTIYSFSEGHVALTTSTNTHGGTAIAHAPTAGAPTRYVVVWHELVGTKFDVRGAFYAGNSPGRSISVRPTACGKTPTTISSSPAAFAGQPFDVQLGNVAGSPVLLLGPPAGPITLCPATGAPCALGIFPVAVTVPGPLLHVDVPCTASIVGGTFAVQGVDVNAAGGCSSAQTGVPLRTTDTLLVIVR